VSRWTFQRRGPGRLIRSLGRDLDTRGNVGKPEREEQCPQCPGGSNFVLRNFLPGLPSMRSRPEPAKAGLPNAEHVRESRPALGASLGPGIYEVRFLVDAHCRLCCIRERVQGSEVNWQVPAKLLQGVSLPVSWTPKGGNMRKLAVLGAMALPAICRADTNLDNLVAGVNTTFATVATVAVGITLFFIGRRLLKRGAS